MSNFYRPGLSEASNFDHPDALDWDSLHSFIDSLSSGDSACHPVFSHKSHSRVGSSPRINPDLVIFHGQFLLYDKQVRDKMHLKIFVDVDGTYIILDRLISTGDDRLATRLTRYTSRYQEKVDEILSQYVRRVKPCFENFVSPTKRWADVILPRGLENTNGTRLIATHLEDILNKKDSFPPLTSAFCLEPDGEALSTDDEGLEEVMK